MEPEPIPGFDAIVQSVAISDTQVSVQFLCSVPFAGAGFQTFCMLGNDEVEEEEEQEEEEQEEKGHFLIGALSCREHG